jgi:hypothetical protein
MEVLNPDNKLGVDVPPGLMPFLLRSAVTRSPGEDGDIFAALSSWAQGDADSGDDCIGDTGDTGGGRTNLMRQLLTGGDMDSLDT